MRPKLSSLLVAVCLSLVFAGQALAAPPAGVTLKPIDGGSDYYCSHGFTEACNNGWDSPTFFPIGPFWGNYVGEQSAWTTEWWNTEFYTQSQSDVTALTADGRFSIPATNVTADAGTVGFDAADEPGSWSAATNGIATKPNAQQDSRPWYVNTTWTFAEYGPPSGTPGGTQASFFTSPTATPNGTTRRLDLGSIDTYWFSAANDSQYPWTSAGGVLYHGGNYGQFPLTTAQAQCGCRYGDMIRPVFGTQVGLPAGHDQASFHTAYPSPIFQYVEDGNVGSTNDVNITPLQMNWAVWSSIIHGARGIIYFDHEFGGSCISDNYVTTTCAATQVGTQRSIVDQMTRTDNFVRQFATKINSQTAIGYETHTPAASTFGGIETRAVYDARPGDCQGQASCFFIMADTRDPEATTNIAATFSTVGGYSGPVGVVNESRTVTASGGSFSDTFAKGSTVHIYGPIPNQ